MTSPKPSRYLLTSPPVSNSARFRSPGIVRRNIIGDNSYQTAQVAKKSRRSKSSETNNRDISSNVLSGKRRLSKQEEGTVEQHLEALNNRWRLMAKNQEKMTKEEIMNNYKLLLTDHIKLEKFMSLISRENELTRTRLESDLLDSMMLVEDLKQSLQSRQLSRRPRNDPNQSEERRELIKQNKKLLSELHESAKKIDKLEIQIFDLQEQVELMDFQMMEAQNQKTIIEEQFEVKGDTKSKSSQTSENFAEKELELLLEEYQQLKKEHENIAMEYSQLILEMKSMQSDNEVLKISEENLQEDLVAKINEIKLLKKDIEVLEDRVKNSLDDAPVSVGDHGYVRCPTSRDDDTIVSNFEDLDDLSVATDSGFDFGDVTSRKHNAVNGHIRLIDKDSGLLGDTIKMLLSMIKEKEEEILKLRSDITGKIDCGNYYKSFYDGDSSFGSNNSKTFTMDVTKVMDAEKNDDMCGRHSPVGACCSSSYKLQMLEKENRRWKSFVEHIGKSENEMLQVIADLEENMRSKESDFNNLKMQYESSISTQVKGMRNKPSTDRSAEYFSRQLEEIQLDNSEDEMNALLTESKQVKEEALRQVVRLEDELDTSNRYVEKLDTELTAVKKIELTLRRRIETLEQRLISGSQIPNNSTYKSITELETKISQLETVNSSLIEVNSLEKRRMEEQRIRLKELEQVNKSLNEKLNNMLTKDLFSQKKINRLQAVYEDLLREYAAAKVPTTDKSKITGTFPHHYANVSEENLRLRQQLNELKSKYDDLQSLLVRYQACLFGESKHLLNNNKLSNSFSNKNFKSQLRDFESKMSELTKRSN